MYTTHTHTYMTPRGQKNISLGHAVCVLSHFSRVQLFAAPWTVNHQAFLSMEFSRQEYWNGLSCPPPGIFPSQGLNPHLLHWQAGPEPPGKPPLWDILQ